MSASTVLELFQPALGCCADEAMLAMRQPVRAHGGTCSRCAAALGLHSRPLLQVCRAPCRLPPAMHRSHFNDRASCTRMSGSCSASSTTTRPIVGDHRHGCRRSGRACSAWRAHAGCRGTAAAMRHGCPHAHGVEPRPESCGDHPPMSHACGTRLGGGGVTQHVRCVGAPVRCYRRGPFGWFAGQQCGRTSKLECCELTVAVSSRILTYKILRCGGAALWGRGRERPFRHSLYLGYILLLAPPVVCVCRIS